MVNTEILEGLKQAMARGESLQRAMQSFTNSGYPLEEVEEASHFVQTGAIPIQQSVNPPAPTLQKFPPLPIQQAQKQNSPTPQPKINLPQNPEQKKDIGIGLIVLLVIILVILIGALIGTIFFKDSLSSFFGGLI